MTVQTTAKYALNVALGTGEFVAEKAKGFAGSLRSFDPRSFWTSYTHQVTKTYDELATRGENLRRNISRSAPAKRASAQTKAARTQVKAAATSVRKAFQADAQAARSAAKKVG